MRNRDVIRNWPQKIIAGTLCLGLAAPTTWSQQMRAIEPVRPQAPVIIRPYLAPYVPPVQLTNSARLAALIRAGKMYLTAQDAIAIALENNIDIEVARYNPIFDEWELERMEAGGALPGVPTGSSQVGASTSGQGVSGSQTAAGVTASGTGSNGKGGPNATITQIGPVTPTLDPTVQDATVFSHLSSPQFNPIQSRVTNLIQNIRSSTPSIGQGFITGGNATLTYHEEYLNENAPTDVLNPSSAAYISLSIQHNFLQGFGVAVNSRNITVWKNTVKNSSLDFRTQMMSVVANVLNLYYGLAADYEDLKAKQSAVKVAQQFYENNKKQVELGTMAPLDVTTAEAQVASSEEDLVNSQTALQQQQIQLKNVLSRTGLANPVLREVEIIPIDRIVVPERDNLPPVKNLVATALASRTDIALEKVNLENTQTSTLGTANGVLPQLEGLATLRQNGISGSPKAVPVPGVTLAELRLPNGTLPPGYGPCPLSSGAPAGAACEIADPYFIGGVGNALGQIFRRNFPTETGGGFFAASARNRTAQADYLIDQLQLRQSQLQYQKDSNQIIVDVSNQVTALRQARARYEAAVKNRVLEEQLLSAEQKKFSLGASTTFNVVQQQRDLATAQSSEVAALVTYSNARIALGQTLGTTLTENHITLEEAMSGRVARPSALPASLPSQR